MHVVFKDEESRLLGGVLEIELSKAEAWLADDPRAIRCEIYEELQNARGALVAVFERDADSGEWRERELVAQSA
jgi:hypothetical protein